MRQVKGSSKLSTIRPLALSCAVVAISLVGSTYAEAETIIKHPGDHPRYSVEFEPHLLLGWANLDTNDPFPRRVDLDRNAGVGPGMRLSIPLVGNGFIKTINNNVALGLGADWAHYGADSNVVWFPVVMQWNFFITEVITVFGEPGFAIRMVSGGAHHSDARVDGVMQAGAKFMVSRNVGLTLRAGYPYFSLGVTLLI